MITGKHLSGDTDKSKEYRFTYEDYFASLISKEVKLLELGVARGGSLLMWQDYFVKGTIVGLDRNSVELNEPRIHAYQGDQDDTDLLTRIALEHAPSGFDIIIDDCAHIGELAKISFWHLFEHHLKSGGIYAIEDWGTGYWRNRNFPDGNTYRLRDKTTILHWLANRSSVRDSRILRRLLRHYRYTRRFIGHNYGMVGFVKQLVDECGMQDITNPDWGRPPQRLSRISKMLVSPGLVIVSKA